VRTLVRSRVPRIPFEEIKNRVLGKDYELSIVLNGDALARRLNTERRQKTYAANVLSFPLNPQEGEIFLNVPKAAREAKTEGVSHRTWLMFLFIHGILHLKGLDHGSTMERTETKLLREFDKRSTSAAK
jgi:probable rRNA maturation factor